MNVFMKKIRMFNYFFNNEYPTTINVNPPTNINGV